MPAALTGHDPPGHPTDAFEQVPESLAGAFSVLARHQGSDRGVRIREREHEDAHTSADAMPVDVHPARNRPVPRPRTRTGPENPCSRSRRNCSLNSLTLRLTVDRETFTPCSSTRRWWMRVAVCRCLLQLSRSSDSHCPNKRHVWVEYRRAGSTYGRPG